jgi:hypothetical protein
VTARTIEESELRNDLWAQSSVIDEDGERLHNSETSINKSAREDEGGRETYRDIVLAQAGEFLFRLSHPGTVSCCR